MPQTRCLNKLAARFGDLRESAFVTVTSLLCRVKLMNRQVLCQDAPHQNFGEFTNWQL